MNAFEARDLTKTFPGVTALDAVSLAVPEGAVVGLIGTNGSGKTTLLRHISGLYLPTRGECTTLGRPSSALGPAELARIGIAHQEANFLYWMSVEEQVRYVASFYRSWDIELERRLLRELDLDPKARVVNLSPGSFKAPPGYYMLFVLKGDGVPGDGIPSMAEFVHVP